MTMRTWLRRAYRRIDRLLISRLPENGQRKLINTSLHLMRTVFPKRKWPDSAEPLMARRHLLPPPKSRRSLPEWARQDMLDLAQSIDPTVSPETFSASVCASYTTPLHWNQAGRAYYRLSRRIACLKFDTVILAPYLSDNDTEAQCYARACHESFGQQTLVIATEPHHSASSDSLPKGVHYLEIGRELTGLSAEHAEPEIVLTRLLVQLAPKRIHTIRSALAWRTFSRNGLALRQASRLYASFPNSIEETHTCDDHMTAKHLAGAAPHLAAIITDSSDCTLQLDVGPDRFHVVPPPPWETFIETLRMVPGYAD